MNWNFYNKTPQKKSKKEIKNFQNQKKEIKNFQKIKKKKSKIQKFKKKPPKKTILIDFIAHLLTYVCIEITMMFLYSLVLIH